MLLAIAELLMRLRPTVLSVRERRERGREIVAECGFFFQVADILPLSQKPSQHPDGFFAFGALQSQIEKCVNKLARVSAVFFEMIVNSTFALVQINLDTDKLWLGMNLPQFLDVFFDGTPFPQFRASGLALAFLEPGPEIVIAQRTRLAVDTVNRQVVERDPRTRQESEKVPINRGLFRGIAPPQDLTNDTHDRFIQQSGDARLAFQNDVATLSG